MITRCEPCLAHHVRDAVGRGWPAGIIEAASVGVNFGGAPSFVFVYSVLTGFLEDVEGGKEPGNFFKICPLVISRDGDEDEEQQALKGMYDARGEI